MKSYSFLMGVQPLIVLPGLVRRSLSGGNDADDIAFVPVAMAYENDPECAAETQKDKTIL